MTLVRAIAQEYAAAGITANALAPALIETEMMRGISQFVEQIPVGRFFLRSGIGRRSGGAYYTPHAFVRYLVRETLTPLVASPVEIGDPAAILRIKVFDPAMGSGHFLVEACRFLADALYEACRRCDVTGDAEARLAVTWPASCGAALCTVCRQRIFPVLRSTARTANSWFLVISRLS